MKEKTKNRIIVLILAIALFSIRWAHCALDRDYSIEAVKSEKSISQESKRSKIAGILDDYDDVSNICLVAIIVYSLGIAGYIYFDRRERNEK